jgi:ribosomal protein S18 acetylase RimI-like enzyme
MLSSTIVSSNADLQAILDLQHQNLKQLVSEAEKQSQGFVTVEHSFTLLQQMHEQAPSILVKEGMQLAGYALVMLTECRELVPELISMFNRFDTLQWKGKLLNAYKYYAMGQICVAKAFRGQGVFDLLYQKHKQVYQHQFDFIVTEVSVANLRSLRAHQRVGFVTIDTYKDHIDEWEVVLWDWS